MRPASLVPILCALAFAAAAVAATPTEDALRRGKELLRASQLDAAEEAFEEAIELAPASAEAHHLLGAVYGRQVNNVGAFGKMRLAGKIKDEFERAVELAPDELDYREDLIQFYAQAPAMMGGGIDKARAQAAEIGKRDAVRGMLAEALIARIEEKPDAALALYRSAIAARPDDPKLGIALGLYLQELKRWDDAFAQFQSIVARQPEAMPAWYQIGRTAVLANARHAEGEAAFKRYLAHKPDVQDPPLAATHWRLGMLYEQTQRVADARREYQAALALEPEHKEAKAALKKLKP